jgi:hypothetical protein
MPAKKKIAEEVAELTATGARAPTPATDAPPQPSGTRVVTDEMLNADRAFVASLDETTDALGNGPDDEPEATVTEDQTGSQGSVAERETVDAPRADAASPVRGAVNRLVTSLLLDAEGLSYVDIVARVVAAHPEAKTTARSVASTDSVLRRKGTRVPMRRAPKA